MITMIRFFLVGLAVAFSASGSRVLAQHASHDHVPQAAVSSQPLHSLANALADGSAALAADDFAAYQRAQSAIRDSLKELAKAEPELAKALSGGVADPVPAKPTIAAARKDFAGFSTRVTDALRSRKLVSSANLRVYECTMVPQVGTARWLQRDSGAKNPFFGAAMLNCGTEVDPGKPTASALPAGHPPIGHLTAAQRDQYKATKAESTCGSCGMSQAAMAAGEACGPTAAN